MYSRLDFNVYRFKYLLRASLPPPSAVSPQPSSYLVTKIPTL